MTDARLCGRQCPPADLLLYAFIHAAVERKGIACEVAESDLPAAYEICARFPFITLFDRLPAYLDDANSKAEGYSFPRFVAHVMKSSESGRDPASQPQPVNRSAKAEPR